MLRILSSCLVSVLVLGSVLAEAGAIKVAKHIVLTGPNTCSKRESIDVTVSVTDNWGGGKHGAKYTIVLREKDLLFHDLIGTKEIVGPDKPETNTTKSVTFSFVPKKYEWGKTIELFITARRTIQGLPAGKWSNKKDPLRVRCK